MEVSLEVLSQPTQEPISLGDAKAWLRVDYGDEDSIVTQLITDARQHAEDLTKKAIPTQTIRATFEPYPLPSGPLSGPVGEPMDMWLLAERPDIPLFGSSMIRFQLPMSPAQSIVLVEYQLTRMDVPEWTTLAPTDANGNDNYRLFTASDPSEVSFFTILAASRYRITYTAGYSVVPRALTRAMMRLVAYWYDHRDGEEEPEKLAAIESQFATKKRFEL